MFRSWKALLTLPTPWKPHHSQPSLPQSDQPHISPDLHHSNRNLDEVEVTETQSCMAQLKSALVRLQRRRLKCALRLRESTQKLPDDHKSILSIPSLFGRLSYEIILMIFLMCPQGGNLTDAPLLFCRICRQWRNIALDTPQLWCSPRCDIRLGRLDCEIAGLVTWLRRSGRDHPLNLSLHFDDRCSPSDCYGLFEVAKSVSLRWKSLAICLSNSSSAFSLFDQLDTTNIPQLESLTILNLWDSYSHRSSTPPARPVFSAALALRALAIEGIPPTEVRQHVCVKNLTKLYVRNFSVYHLLHEYLQLLEGCSNLMHCSIHCLLDWNHSSYIFPRLRTLPKLMHLQIKGSCRSQFSVVGILLNALACPQLEFVSINFRCDYCGHYDLAEHPRNAFLTFIERSTNTLSLDPRAADPYLLEMVASVGPRGTIWTSDGEWYRTSSLSRISRY